MREKYLLSHLLILGMVDEKNAELRSDSCHSITKQHIGEDFFYDSHNPLTNMFIWPMEF